MSQTCNARWFSLVIFGGFCYNQQTLDVGVAVLKASVSYCAPKGKGSLQIFVAHGD